MLTAPACYESRKVNWRLTSEIEFSKACFSLVIASFRLNPSDNMLQPEVRRCSFCHRKD